MICSTQRSGSSLLSLGLDDLPGAAVPMEYFNQPLRDRLAPRWGCGSGLDGYVDALHRHRTNAQGLFGAKLHWHHLIALYREALGDDHDHDSPYDVDAGFLEPIFPACRFVWILRRDVAAQAVSLFHATATGAWAEFVNPPGGVAAERPGDARVRLCVHRSLPPPRRVGGRVLDALLPRQRDHAVHRRLRGVRAGLRGDAASHGAVRRLRPARRRDPPAAIRRQRNEVSEAYVEAYMRERLERGTDNPAMLPIDTLPTPGVR